MQRSRSILKGLLKLLGPIFFVFILVRVIDSEKAAGLLKDIDLRAVLISVLLFPLVNAALTVRWQLICKRLGVAVPFGDLFQIYCISWFLSALPVAGVSPVAKYAYLKEEARPAAATIVSIILDKLFDIIGLLLFGMFGLLYVPRIFTSDIHLWLILGGVFLLCTAMLAFSKTVWKTLMARIRAYSNKRLQKIGTRLESELAGFWSDLRVGFFLLTVAVSIGIGIVRALVLYILAIALNIHVGFALIVACRALIGIVNIIPVTISGLGTRDAILLLALPAAGVSKEAAIALAFLAFLWTIGSKLSGIVFWLKRPLPANSWRELKEKGKYIFAGPNDH